MGAQDYGELLALYVFCHVSRAVAIAALFPLMNMTGFGVTIKEAVVITISGLRGMGDQNENKSLSTFIVFLFQHTGRGRAIFYFYIRLRSWSHSHFLDIKK